ncbi:nucleoside deaminase [Streptomyces sp. NPDC059740]|uniref:nucleoside deaminase n=1 Tax=Streptomyces sp. NPDC059740 TaxID=3346926 RepID=UPI00365C01CE
MVQTADPEALLQRAVDLSQQAVDAGGRPFGALVVLDGRTVGEGRNRVAPANDPTAHAEIEALRAAGRSLGRPVLEGAVLYASSEPCPMCLAACYWAGVTRVVHAATTDDVAACGLADRRLYRELALPKESRALPAEQVPGSVREEAVVVLRRWARSADG